MSQHNDGLSFLGEFLFSMVNKSIGAITTQPYTEVNSKNGLQYELSFSTENLTNGSVLDVAIETGTHPISIKGVVVTFTGTGLNTQLFKGGSYTGGVSIPSYTLRDGTGNAALVDFLGGVSVTAIGSAVGPDVLSLGSSSVGNSVLTSLSTDTGVERILEQDSTYIYRLSNNSGATQDISGVITFYEGPLDSDITI